jgi:hypothetical protein
MSIDICMDELPMLIALKIMFSMSVEYIRVSFIGEQISSLGGPQHLRCFSGSIFQ